MGLAWAPGQFNATTADVVSVAPQLYANGTLATSAEGAVQLEVHATNGRVALGEDRVKFREPPIKFRLDVESGPAAQMEGVAEVWTVSTRADHVFGRQRIKVEAAASGDARAMGVVGAIASLCVGTNEFVRAVTRDGGDDSRASDAMARVMTMGRSVGASRCPARRARRGARRELARGDRRTNRRGVDVAREAMDEADARALDDGSRSTLAFDFRAHEACVRAALVAAGSRDDAAAAEATKTTTTKTNETLGVTTTTEVWSTSRFRRVRSTYVDGGELAQIYNCVVYPSPAACDAPMLGVDLISLGKGAARKVLIGVDLHPMSRDREYASAYVPALEALRRGPGKVADAAAALGATTPSKKFYRDATFFSRGIFFARPERADEETMTRSLDVVRAYVDAWTARLDEAEREAEAMDGACKFGLALEDVRRCVLTEEAARDAQDAHDAWQLAHDPAIPMFAKWYGEEWAREFAETVLFPGARERLASS